MAFTISAIDTSTDGLTLRLTPAGVTLPIDVSGAFTSDFTVNGAGTNPSVVGISYNGTSHKIELTLAAAIFAGETITLDYAAIDGTIVDSDVGTPLVLGAFTAHAVTNNSTLTSPSLISAEVAIDGLTILLTFNSIGNMLIAEEVDPALWTVGGASTSPAITQVGASFNTLTLSLEWPIYSVASENAITLSYAGGVPGDVTDSDTPRNDLAAITDFSVTNSSTLTRTAAGLVLAWIDPDNTTDLIVEIDNGATGDGAALVIGTGSEGDFTITDGDANTYTPSAIFVIDNTHIRLRADTDLTAVTQPVTFQFTPGDSIEIRTTDGSYYMDALNDPQDVELAIVIASAAIVPSDHTSIYVTVTNPQSVSGTAGVDGSLIATDATSYFTITDTLRNVTYTVTGVTTAGNNLVKITCDTDLANKPILLTYSGQADAIQTHSGDYFLANFSDQFVDTDPPVTTSNGASMNGVNTEFDTGAVVVDDASNYILIGLFYPLGRRSIFRGAVGAGGALAHLKITRAVTVGGTHNDWLSDAQIAHNAIAGDESDNVTTVIGTPYTTGANLSFQFGLDSDAAEYAIYAKKAGSGSAGNTTLQLTGTHFSRR